jgi:branched-chain amino acid:cation transporter, LIVCS family
MKNVRLKHIVSTGLAIFSMLFGAGNLMYPLQVGMVSGSLTLFGMLGFMLTAVCLPIAGLIGMLLFNGDLRAFYHRLGTVAGSSLLFISILILGPLVAIPRITTLSHTMTAPFLPSFLQTVNLYSSFMFACIFLGVTFLATYRENKIVDILGKFISPLLLTSLTIIIVLGIIQAHTLVPSSLTAFEAFAVNTIRGYETLDLLGAIFFASIILTVLKGTIGTGQNPRELATVGLQSGLLGVLLLAIVYAGMSFLGAYHSHGLAHVNAGELFREVSFNVLGSYGALLISTAVLMACLSTSIAICAVIAEYVQNVIFRHSINYISALLIVVLASLPLSTFGLSYVLELTAGPIIYIGYPVLIVLTFCNIGYKLFDFKPVKIPVLLAFLLATTSYYAPAWLKKDTDVVAIAQVQPDMTNL